MALTPSTMMLPLGSPIPTFSLTDPAGKPVTNRTLEASPAALVMFICNHCPFVKHIRAELARLGRDYTAKGVGIVAINSNDAQAYLDDSPAKMVEEARSAGYTFPYVFDADQSVAKSFKAACTPDFFVFAQGRGLIYRGQLDNSRPDNSAAPLPVTGADLRRALDAAISGKAAPRDQKPSIGCNIKWKPRNEPIYLTSLA